jgi:hypothetical protein
MKGEKKMNENELKMKQRLKAMLYLAKNHSTKYRLEKAFDISGMNILWVTLFEVNWGERNIIDTLPLSVANLEKESEVFE